MEGGSQDWGGQSLSWQAKIEAYQCPGYRTRSQKLMTNSQGSLCRSQSMPHSLPCLASVFSLWTSPSPGDAAYRTTPGWPCLIPRYCAQINQHFISCCSTFLRLISYKTIYTVTGYNLFFWINIGGEGGIPSNALNIWEPSQQNAANSTRLFNVWAEFGGATHT